MPARRGNPHLTARVTRTGAAVVTAALLLAACDGDNGLVENGTPTPPTENETEEPAAPALDEDTAVALLTGWFDTVHGLPPTDPDDVVVDGAGEGIVIRDSPADDWITVNLTQAVDLGVIDRGDVVVEVIEVFQETRANSARALACASQDVEPTDLATGDPAGPPDAPRLDDYVRLEATYQLVDGQWLLASATGVEPQDCVPPSIEAAVTANWEAFIDAVIEWGRRGAPGDDIGELADLTTGGRQEAHRSSPGLDPGARSEREGLDHDLQLHRATRTRVEGEWCFDPARNAEAGLYEADGTFTPMTELTGRRYERAEWELVDGAWLLSEQESLGPDHPGAPDEHRCF